MTLLKKPELSIVIPAYNEEKRIGKSLDSLSNFLKKDRFFRDKHVEVIIVAANASDRSHAIINSRKKGFSDFKFLKPGLKSGKGRDVQYGMLRANGKYAVYMDADLATPLHHLRKFYKSCEDGNDIVVGTRNLLKHHPDFKRRIISNAGNVLFRVVGGLWIEDSQCGFKMFNHHANQVCFSRLSIMGWGFDMEILTIAKVNNLKIEKVRIDDWIDMPNSTFTDGLAKTLLRSLLELSLIALNRVKGQYKDST